MTRKSAEEALHKAGALQRAIFNSANFSSIATDAKGVIQIFNVGAERMLGYKAAEVIDKITPADISDPQELIARAKALSAELTTTITPGFEALVFKATRGIEDIYELTYIRKDGSRFPAVVSVTALRDAQDDIIGYLLIGTDNTARKLVEAEQKKLDQRLRDQHLYGEKQFTYFDGARPAERPEREYIPHADAFREAPPAEPGPGVGTPPTAAAEIKAIYRRLARRSHPDLAISEADRQQRTAEMAEINRAYAAGDLAALQKLADPDPLAGLSVPTEAAAPLSEEQHLKRHLDQVRQRLANLSRHPSVQLSLEVKLARRAGRDLLAEMAQALKHKVARKVAERDYLRSQLDGFEHR